jgi:glutathione peroxidase
MFEKISVKGDDQHPLYQWLSKKELNGWNDEAPKWNFTKYLVNEKGELIKVFPSKVKPTDKEVVDAINS